VDPVPDPPLETSKRSEIRCYRNPILYSGNAYKNYMGVKLYMLYGKIMIPTKCIYNA
jgi:hypothetical protein